jgi:predicted enzyme related to lactoylglutathione lyase/ribosomal protein S18 acetylase RimI-like enzyme
MLKRPVSVVYFVADVAAARNWYRQLLGAQPVQDDAAFVRFALEGTDLCFHPADEKTGLASGVPAAPAARQVAYWKVDNLAKTLARCQELGGKLYRGPIPTPDGARVCQMADPFGNVLGLMEAPTLSVRPATAADDQAVAAVWASATATLRQTYRPTPVAVARAGRELSPRKRLVAQCQNQIAGTVEYYLDGLNLHLLRLGVDARYRKQGVARALLDHLTQIASTAGASRLSLYTVRQTGNVAIFERLGFRCIREEVAADLVGNSSEAMTEAYMERSVG